MFQFDNDPRLYLSICNLLLILLAFLSFWPLLRDSGKSKIYLWALLITISLVFIGYRLPVIVYNVALNPDENLFIVGAMTLVKKHIFWKSVDSGSSGPFNVYIITVFCELFKQPYDYVSARIVGAGLMLGSIILNFLTLKKFFSLKIAALSIFPVVAWLATTRYSNFVHYSSEHLPIFLLSIISYLYVLLSEEATLKLKHLFLLGFIAGMIPFAKLQAAPVAAFIAFITYWLIYSKKKNNSALPFAVLTLGGLSIPLILVALGIYYHFLDDMWTSYIQYNLSYGNKQSMWLYLTNSFADPVNFHIKIVAALTVWVLIHRLYFLKQYKLTAKSVFTIVFVSVSIFSVYKTGYMFHHYLLFLVFPSAFLFAYFLDGFLSIRKTIINYAIVGTLLVTILAATLIIPTHNEYITVSQTKRPLEVSDIGHVILKYTQPTEPLVIWGDHGSYYLETKRVQGIRWSNSHWGMYSDTVQKLCTKQFVKEFKEQLSPVFIDTHVITGSTMVRTKLGYETVPELKELIDTHYRFLTEINQQRVYIRNDRYEEINKSIAQLTPGKVISSEIP